MPDVQTVLGPVDTAKLGFTLMHEHVFTRSPGVFEAWPHLWDRAAEIDNAVKTFTELKAAGVDTIVDLTTIDLGRDIRMVEEVAKRVDMHIIACTGVWRNPPQYFQRSTPEALADLFVRDIEQGIEGTSIRAGIIKNATEPTVDDENEIMLRAGARAHRRTGVPISTHSHPASRSGLQQQDVFESEGVDLSRVVIGHSGDTEDTDYLAEIIGRGSFVGMDRFGLDMLLSMEKRIDTVANLVKMGLTGNVVLSHDVHCYMDTISRPMRDERMPHWNFFHITQDVLPGLRERGVTEDQIREMTVTNPKKVFDRQGAY